MTKHKPVTIEGLTFSNDYGRGLRAQVDDDRGSLTIRNGGFRENVGSGMFVSSIILVRVLQVQLFSALTL